MGKILYIEDELKANDIMLLFDKYLSDEERDILSMMQKERRQRRENIKKLLDGNPFIHVEYNFINAIKAVIFNTDDFSFFVIDRNLYGSTEQEKIEPEYDINDVPQIIDENVQEKCEGDYLFLILLNYYWKHSNPRLLLENFYFLTAYPPEKQPMTIKDSLGKLLLLFDQKNHVIEKGGAQINDFIENKINKFEELVIKSKHREVFEIFNKGYLNISYENNLLEVLKNVNTRDRTKIEGYVCNLRNIFQEMLRKISGKEKINRDMPENYYKGGNLKPGSILWFLSGSPKYSETKKIKETTSDEFISNSTYSFCDSFWTVCSEISHGGKSENRNIQYLSTQYTLPALVNVLLDFLVWFDAFMDKNKLR